MKAILKKLKEVWCVVIPPTDNLFPMEEVEANPLKFAVPIYKLKDIVETPIKKWEEGIEVTGDILRENKKVYFALKDVKYKLELTEETSRALTLLKGLMLGFEHICINSEQYNYIYQVAKSENLISSYFSNGYCVNYKYVVYGKLTKNKKVIYPQIKIK